MTENTEQQQAPGAQRVHARELERYAAYLADLRAGGLGDRNVAEEATRAVLCVLEQRIPGGVAQRMLAALPTPLVELQRQCERHRQEPAEGFAPQEFFSRVADHLGLSVDEALSVTRVVLMALRAQLPMGEVNRVAQELPSTLRGFWSPDRYGGRDLQQEMERYYLFLGELHESRLVPDEQAEPVAQTVLCTLEERLSGGEAADVLQGLPVRLRQLLTRCRRSRHAPAPRFGKATFVERVATSLGLSPPQAEAVVRAVLSSARKLLPVEEAYDVRDQLPNDLKDLWLAPVPAVEPPAPQA